MTKLWLTVLLLTKFRWYIVLYFLSKTPLLLLTNHKIRGLVGSQNGANIHSSMPTSLQDPAINLHTSVVDFIYFRRLVESPLYFGRVAHKP